MGLRNRTKVALSIDCVVFRAFEEQHQVLLIKRGKDPFINNWALPGGFLENHETLEECAFRELSEETGLTNIFLQQVHTYSAPDRDPRGRVVTTSFYAVLQPFGHSLKAKADAKDAKWWNIRSLPKLAFDHKHILKRAINKLQQDLIQTAVIFEVLPQTFTLSQVQSLLEVFLQKNLDKRNFRKKLLAYDFLVDTGDLLKGRRQRPAKLYRFSKKNYEKLAKNQLIISLL